MVIFIEVLKRCVDFYAPFCMLKSEKLIGNN